MKFNVPSKMLYTYVAAVCKVINSKNAMTILNNLLFSLEGDTLTITASDLENTLSATLTVTEPEGEGKFCVDAKRVVDLLKELPDLGVNINVNDETLAIDLTYPGGKFSLVGINGNEYPNTREAVADDQKMTFTAPMKQVMSGIDNTLFAVGNDPVRPQMMGILWDIKPEQITFVATDTRKLVRYINTMSAPGIEGSFILPVKPANIIKNVFAKDEEIEITLDPKSATFSTPAFNFNCRFIKGNFPDYNRVIPQTNPYALTIDRTEFLNAVRRVGVFVDPGNGLVKFKLNTTELVMKAQDTNFCTSARETMSCDFNGPEMIIGFSAHYLIEIFNTIATEQIIINLSDPSRPGVFVPDTQSENGDLLMLLMPMTVHDF
ncbi:MAG: DNA polymerase III subunit beta [Muribaculaceae bacterium]|nr:DNA polymerase III subunit beta [Muribaculaceae bacterium]